MPAQIEKGWGREKEDNRWASGDSTGPTGGSKMHCEMEGKGMLQLLGKGELGKAPRVHRGPRVHREHRTSSVYTFKLLTAVITSEGRRLGAFGCGNERKDASGCGKVRNLHYSMR